MFWFPQNLQTQIRHFTSQTDSISSDVLILLLVLIQLCVCVLMFQCEATRINNLKHFLSSVRMKTDTMSSSPLVKTNSLVKQQKVIVHIRIIKLVS